MPGAVMSGLMMSGASRFGPRDENLVIDGAEGHDVVVFCTTSRAVGSAAVAMYSLMASPGVWSTCTPGTEWLSVNRLPSSVVS